MRTSGSTLISLAIGNAMSDYHVANRLNHGLHQGTRGDFSVAEKKEKRCLRWFVQYMFTV